MIYPIILGIFLLSLVSTDDNSCDVIPKTQEFIYGGNKTNIIQRPFQASLLLNGKHYCGGTIISPRHILTTANCLLGIMKMSHLTVRVGSTCKDKGGTVVHVKRLFRHPLYNRVTQDYDFGILELSKSLKFTKRIRAAKISKGRYIKDRTPLLISGYGISDSKKNPMSKLRIAVVPKIKDRVCNKLYKKIFGGITKRMFCIKDFNRKDKSACYGDQGGPVTTKRGELVGIISWTYSCGLTDYAGINSRIEAVRSWINRITNA